MGFGSWYRCCKRPLLCQDNTSRRWIYYYYYCFCFLRLNRRLNYSKYSSHPSPGTSLVESKRYPLAKAFMVLIWTDKRVKILLAITLFVPNGGKEGEGEGEISSESNKMLGNEKQPYLCYRETTKERVHGTNKKEQMRDSKGLYSFTKLQQKQTPHCREVSKMG